MKSRNQLRKKPIRIDDDVYEFLMGLTAPKSLTIHASHEEFVAELVKDGIRKTIENVKEKGYILSQL